MTVSSECYTAGCNRCFLLNATVSRLDQSRDAQDVPIHYFEELLKRAAAFPRREIAPELSLVPPSIAKRAQGMPGAGRPHGPPAKQKAGGSHHRSSQITRHSLHDSFNAYIALSLGTGLSCSHRPRDHHLANLASASGGQDHAISRPPRHRSSACAERTREAKASIASRAHVR
jgi:hypothetical protein